MTTRTLLMTAAMMLAASTTRPLAGAGDQELSAQEGVRLMRIVMSVQSNAPFRHAFGDLAQIVAVSPLPRGAKMVDAYTATYKGYRLVMIASSDSRAFQAMLVPADGCGSSWFGSEKGVIYSGEPLGCR